MMRNPQEGWVESLPQQLFGSLSLRSDPDPGQLDGIRNGLCDFLPGMKPRNGQAEMKPVLGFPAKQEDLIGFLSRRHFRPPPPPRDCWDKFYPILGKSAASWRRFLQFAEADQEG
ncbi:MAG: hypothetical protein ACR2PL_20355, partial [Dehalococcoidia bacterium]